MTLNKEKIIICKSSSDYKRYRDTLVKSGAQNVFIGEKSISFLTLSTNIVLRYQVEIGQSVPPVLINERDMVSVIYFSILKLLEEGKLTYFKDNMFSYSLASEIRKTMKKIIEENVYDEFIKIDTPKIKDVVCIMNATSDFCTKKGALDGVLYFTEEQLYKKALDVLKEHKEFVDTGFEYEYIGDSEISAVQKELLSFYTANLIVDNAPSGDIRELVKGYSSIAVQRSYGNNNEIYGVIKDVLTNKYNLNDVAVLLTSSNEMDNVLSTLNSLGVPYKCASPLSAARTDIYYLLKEIFNIEPNFVAEEVAFNTIKQTPISEEYVNYLISIRDRKTINAKEFVIKTAMFVKGYFTPPNSENISEALVDVFSIIPNGCELSHERARSFVLNAIKTAKSTLTTEENECGVLVGPLPSVTGEVRPHLYILGMDSSSFGIQKSESPIMSDDELKNIGVRNTDFNMLSLSREREERRLAEVVYNTSRLIGASLFISYVAYDSTLMMYKNPSSFIMKLKKLDKVKKTSVSFSDRLISKDHIVDLENKYATNKDAENGIISPYPYKLNELSLSATSVKTFLDCQRKFYFGTVLKVKPEENVEIDLGVWLEKNIQGDFIHEALKEYVRQSFVDGRVQNLVPDKQKMQKVIETHKKIDEELLSSIINKLDKTYSKQYPALKEVHAYELSILTSAIRSEVEYIIENLSKSYPVATEWTSDTQTEIEGMTFSQNSRIDRIDYNIKEGSYTIVDYKVKSPGSANTFKQEHNGKQEIEENNNVQEYLYYLIVNEYLKKHGINERANAFVFRLVMTNEGVVPSDLMYSGNIISDKVKKIKDAYNNKTWKCTDDNKKCTYCDYKSICNDLINNNNKGEEKDDE